MALDLETIGIAFDTSGTEKQTRANEALATSSEKAAEAIDAVESSNRRANDAVAKLLDQVQRQAAAVAGIEAQLRQYGAAQAAANDVQAQAIAVMQGQQQALFGVRQQLFENTDAQKKSADAAQNLIDKLTRQAATWRMTADEVRKYDAAAAQMTDAQRRHVAQLQDTIDKQEKLNRAYDQGREIGSQAAKAITAAFVAAEAAAIGLYVGINKLIEQVGDFQDLSEKTGMDPLSLAMMKAAADVTGTSLESLGSMSTRLSLALAKTDDESRGVGQALAAIGISVSQFKSLRPEEQIATLATAFGQYEDGAGKAAVANAALGRGGAQMLPFLKEYAQETAHGTALTLEQIKAADDYSDAMKRSKAELIAQAQVLSVQTIPTMVAAKGAAADYAKALFGIGEASDALGKNTAVQDFAERTARFIAVLVDMVDGLARGFQILGESLAANAALIGTTLGSLVKATGQLAGKDFIGAFDTLRGAVTQNASVWTDYQRRMGDIWNRPYFGTQLDKRLAEIKDASSSMGGAFNDRRTSAAEKFALNPDLTGPGKAGKADIDALGKLIDQLTGKATGTQPDFIKNLGLLNEGLASGRVGREQFDQLTNALIVQQPYFKAYVKDIEEETKAREKEVDAVDKATERVQAEILKTNERTAAVGLHKDAVHELEAQRLMEQAAALDGLATAQLEVRGREGMVAALQAQAQAVRDLAGAKRSEASAERNQDTLKAIHKAAEETEKRFVRVMDNVDRTFHEGFQETLRNGRKGWDAWMGGLVLSFKTTVADAIYGMFVRPFVVNVVGNALGMSGAASGMASAGGNSIASLFGSAGSSAAGSGLSGMFSAGGAYNAAGGALGIDAIGGGMASLGEQAAITSAMGGSAAGATGASLMAAIPGWGWAALAATAVLGSGVFSSKGGPKTDGRAGYINSGIGSGGLDGTVGAAVGASQARYAAFLAGIGGSGGFQFGAGVSTDPNGSSPTFVDTTLSKNGETFWTQLNRGVGRDDASMQAALSGQLSEAMFRAVKGSTLPDMWREYFDAVSDDASAEVKASAITYAQNLVAATTAQIDAIKKQVASVTQSIGQSVNQLYNETATTKSASYRAAMSFIDSAIAGAQAGTIPDQAGLSDAIAGARAGLSNTQFATQTDAKRARLVLAGKLSELQRTTGAIDGTAQTNAELADIKAQMARLIELQKAANDLAKSTADAVNGNPDAPQLVQIWSPG